MFNIVFGAKHFWLEYKKKIQEHFDLNLCSVKWSIKSLIVLYKGVDLKVQSVYFNPVDIHIIKHETTESHTAIGFCPNDYFPGQKTTIKHCFLFLVFQTCATFILITLRKE